VDKGHKQAIYKRRNIIKNNFISKYENIIVEIRIAI
jgi:hypothetical protein